MAKDEILNVIQSRLLHRGVVLETINYSFWRYKGAEAEVVEENYIHQQKIQVF